MHQVDSGGGLLPRNELVYPQFQYLLHHVWEQYACLKDMPQHLRKHAQQSENW
jgi:hypothetical protein